MNQLKPNMGVSILGKINWESAYVNYNADAFYRGKKVTSEEFKDLFLAQTYQSNYLASTLDQFFKTDLNTAIERTIQSAFTLRPSYVKSFKKKDWVQHADGYYYITITPEEHGLKVNATPLDNSVPIVIDTEMYIITDTDQFLEVQQVIVKADNTVLLYTDDPDTLGYVVIRDGGRAYAYSSVQIDASNITGLNSVALTGDYNDLNNKPDTRIKALEENYNKLIDSTKVYPTALYATYADRADEAEQAETALAIGPNKTDYIALRYKTGTLPIVNSSIGQGDAITTLVNNIQQYAEAVIEVVYDTPLGRKIGYYRLPSNTTSATPQILATETYVLPDADYMGLFPFRTSYRIYTFNLIVHNNTLYAGFLKAYNNQHNLVEYDDYLNQIWRINTINIINF